MPHCQGLSPANLLTYLVVIIILLVIIIIIVVTNMQQVGRIHVAAFSDANLYAEVANKAFFWMQPSFYNIDITCLHKEASEGYFTQVCYYTPICTLCIDHHVGR